MKWNKFGVLMLMAMLVISIVPAAFAEEGTDVSVRTGDSMAVTTSTGSSNDSVKVRVADARVAARTGIRDEVKALREKIVGLRNAKLHVRSEIAQSKLALNEARQQYMKDKDAVAKACKSKDDTSDECTDTRVKVKLEAQTTLLASADHVLDVLAETKTRVEANDALTADEKAKIVADIDAKSAKIQSARDAVAALNEDSTREEIAAATKQLRDAWREVRVSIKMHAGQLAYGELKAVLAGVQRLSDRLEQTIDRMEANGADVSEVTALKVTFDAQLDAAQTHLDAAVAAYTGIKADNVDSKDKTVRTEMQAARESLRSAHKTLKEITQKLRTQLKETREDKKDERKVNATVKAKATVNASADDNENDD